MAHNVNNSNIKVSYKIMDYAGYLIGTGYENICVFEEASFNAYESLLKDMIRNYFENNLGNTKLNECSVLSLRLLLGIKKNDDGETKENEELSQRKANMEYILKKIIPICKSLAPEMSLAELLLGMEIIV